jgi:hypothetical protein
MIWAEAAWACIPQLVKVGVVGVTVGMSGIPCHRLGLMTNGLKGGGILSGHSLYAGSHSQWPITGSSGSKAHLNPFWHAGQGLIKWVRLKLLDPFNTPITAKVWRQRKKVYTLVSPQTGTLNSAFFSKLSWASYIAWQKVAMPSWRSRTAALDVEVSISVFPARAVEFVLWMSPRGLTGCRAQR